MVALARMHHLVGIAEASLWFREARSVFPSMTRVATSSISTGAIDIAPTILDLLALQSPKSLLGESLLRPDVRRRSPAQEIFETGGGGFRQRLAVTRRGGHLVPVHDGRAD